uniref:Eukaryotic translation elongation factor 1 beta 2 n=1 Tax=Oryzias melastigma TaxID=30732 RepID=A0A3B3BM10_ORYME
PSNFIQWAGPGPTQPGIVWRFSLIGRYVPSQADVAVFEAITAPPPADLCHALRWYNHIKSYQAQKNSLPGVRKPLGQYGPAGVADTTSGSPAASKDEDDDDIDLFGSDEEEDPEAVKLKEQRLAEYAAKKAKKPTLIAKSSILLDVKPWDDETDMAKLEECVRSIQMDGLVWGQSKLVPVGYGIKKLQISCVVEDDKVCSCLLLLVPPRLLVYSVVAFRWARTSWRRRSQPSRITFSPWMLQHSTRSEMLIK